MKNSNDITFSIRTNFVRDLVKKNKNSKYVRDVRIMEFIEFGYIASRYISYIRKKIHVIFYNLHIITPLLEDVCF